MTELHGYILVFRSEFYFLIKPMIHATKRLFRSRFSDLYKRLCHSSVRVRRHSLGDGTASNFEYINPELPVNFNDRLGRTLPGYELLPEGALLYARQVVEQPVAWEEARENNLIVMLVISALRIDPRVEREARALAEAGYRVRVIAPDISHPPLKEQPINWGPGIEFDILSPTVADFFNIKPYLAGEPLLAAAVQYRPLAFHCHDLNTCLVGLAAARYVGCYCVCDFHEWYSHNVSWNDGAKSWEPHPDEMRKIFSSAEKLVMNQADEVITVCDSIAQELKIESNRMDRQVHVIRNIPAPNSSTALYPSLRDTLSIPANKTVMLWQGGIGPTRLLEPVIQSLAHVENAVFVIRGPSLDLFGEGYRELAKQSGVSERLFLLPPVKSADVVKAANGSDFGIWTLPNLSKNFYYALPNKIFEYLMAGLPIACANFPEARAIVERYRVGVTFDPYDPKSIASAIEKLTESSFRKTCIDNVKLALDDLRADREWKKLIELYDRLAEKDGS